MGGTAQPETGQSRTQDRIQGLRSLIGNTPLLEIRLKYRGQDRLVYAKAEHLNMTGSIKDRMALHIIAKAYESGALMPRGRIIEVTSGNTGIAFAAIGRALGHPVTIFMPDWMSTERMNLVKSLGTEIMLVSNSEGGFRGAIERAGELCAHTEGGFLPHQFSNEANCEAHSVTTGPEIWWQLYFRSRIPAAFVAGVGTGGTIMGVGQFLRERPPSVRLHPLEPASSPTLSTGHKAGSHRIQGISDEFVPPILRLNTLDSVISIDDGDAILMAQKLGSQLGMGVGISSGANLAGAIKLQNELGAEAVVVTVFPDDNKKYLTTDLLRSEPARPGYISLDTEFCAVRALKRVCILAAILRIASKPRRAKLSRNPSCPIAHGGSSLTPTSALCSHRLSEGARQAAKLPVSWTKSDGKRSWRVRGTRIPASLSSGQTPAERPASPVITRGRGRGTRLRGQ